MKRLIGIVLSVTLLICCIFVTASADDEVILKSGYYCGFEDYAAQLTGQTATDTFDGMSFNENVAEIVSENAYVGEKALKISLGAKGITAFEIRNSAPFELEKQEYSVTLAYKSDSSTEISLGMAKAGSVPSTAYEISKIFVDASDSWQTAVISFTADKSFNDGYVPSVMVYAEQGTEIYFDDITIEAVSGKEYVNMPEIDFDPDWYPTLKKPNAALEEEEITIWDGSVAESFAGGSGSEADPYLISNGAELALAITQSGTTTDAETSETVNETYYGSYYRITKDIYLNNPDAIDWKNANGGSYTGLNSWYQWNNGSGENFAGTLDGAGHTIYGLYRHNGSSINYRNHNVGAGLIPATVSGTTVKVSNLAVDNSYIRQRYYAGIIIGKDSGTVIIDNCKVGEKVMVWACTAGSLIGCGNGQTAVVTNSVSFASYGGSGASNYQYGLIGGAIQCILTM